MAERLNNTEMIMANQWNDKNLTYATLNVGRVIRCVDTGERARIDALTNRHGLIEITILDGADSGNTDYLSPAELITYWRKAN